MKTKQSRGVFAPIATETMPHCWLTQHCWHGGKRCLYSGRRTANTLILTPRKIKWPFQKKIKCAKNFSFDFELQLRNTKLITDNSIAFSRVGVPRQNCINQCGLQFVSCGSLESYRTIFSSPGEPVMVFYGMLQESVLLCYITSSKNHLGDKESLTIKWRSKSVIWRPFVGVAWLKYICYYF